MDINKLRKFAQNPQSILDSEENLQIANLALESYHRKKLYGLDRKVIRTLNDAIIREASWFFTPYRIYPILANWTKLKPKHLGLVFTFYNYLSQHPEDSYKFVHSVVNSISFAPRPVNVRDSRSANYFVTITIYLATLMISNHGSKDGVLTPRNFITHLLDIALLDDKVFNLLCMVYNMVNINLKEAGITHISLQNKIQSHTIELLQAELASKESRFNHSDEKTIEVILQKKEEIIILSNLLWDDITRSNWREIRPDGYDWFAIEHIEGCRVLPSYFLKSEDTQPEIIWVQSEVLSSFHSISYYCPRTYIPLHTEEASKYITDDKNGARIIYHQITALLAYHHIVCAPHRYSTGKDRNESTSRQGGDIVPVRATLRKLRSGDSPRPEAYELAWKRLGRELPPGFTFVRDYRAPRGGTSAGNSADSNDPVTTDSTRLLVVVSMKDLLNWIE